MKRLVALACAATFVLGSLGAAQAVEIKASMTWELGLGWADNTGFTDAKQGAHEDAFTAQQRIRPQFNFIASETLEAVLEFEIGTTVWGEGDSGGRIDADSTSPTVRRAYLDWGAADNFRLRMGIQGVAMPSATFGNPVLDTDVAGVVASYEFNENFSATVFWLRPFDRHFDATDQQDGQNVNDEMDVFGLTLPISGDGFAVTPWAMYARLGNQSDYWSYRAGGENDFTDPFGTGYMPKGSSNMWWAGAAIELNFLSPFSIKLDGMYGASSSSEDAPEFSGWLVSGLFEFNTESKWGNPGLIAWYASGDDSDDYKDNKGFGDFGRMPIISNDRAGFAPAAFGFAGSAGCMQDGIISNSGVGTWGLGLQLDGMSFVDNLSHTLRVVYIGGTNDEDMVRNNPNIERFGAPYNIMGDAVYLTKEDYAWEFDFLTSYEVSENLTVFLEANYVYLNLDSGVWAGDLHKTTDAWKAQLLFEYSF